MRNTDFSRLGLGKQQRKGNKTKNINILTYENNFKPYLGHIEIDKGKITKVKEGHPKNEKAIKVIDGKINI